MEKKEKKHNNFSKSIKKIALIIFLLVSTLSLTLLLYTLIKRQIIVMIQNICHYVIQDGWE